MKINLIDNFLSNLHHYYHDYYSQENIRVNATTPSIVEGVKKTTTLKLPYELIDIINRPPLYNMVFVDIYDTLIMKLKQKRGKYIIINELFLISENNNLDMVCNYTEYTYDLSHQWK